MRSRRAFVALALALACAARQPAGSGPAPQVGSDGPPPLQLPDGVRPVHYQLELMLDPARDRSAEPPPSRWS